MCIVDFVEDTLALGKLKINFHLLSTYAYLCIQGFSNGW